MAREDKKNKTIAIVTYPGVALLDLVATKTVLDGLAAISGTMRAGLSLAAPVIAAKPKRLIRQGR